MSGPQPITTTEQPHDGLQFLLQISSSERQEQPCAPPAKLPAQAVTNYWYPPARQPHLQILKPTHQKGPTVCSQLETTMWLLRDRVPSPQMGKQRGSTQQMVGAREGNKRRPHPPFLAAAFTKGKKEALLTTSSLGAVLQKLTMCSRRLPLREGFARQPYAARPWHFRASRFCPNTISTSPIQVNFKEPFTEIPLYSALCSHTMTKPEVTRQNRQHLNF